MLTHTPLHMTTVEWSICDEDGADTNKMQKRKERGSVSVMVLSKRMKSSAGGSCYTGCIGWCWSSLSRDWAALIETRER